MVAHTERKLARHMIIVHARRSRRSNDTIPQLSNILDSCAVLTMHGGLANPPPTCFFRLVELVIHPGIQADLLIADHPGRPLLLLRSL